MTTAKQYRRVLTIAGSDSGGGAGVQADLKTFAANGCYGMSVITALTAQNTRGVCGIHAVPVDFVAAQIDAVLSDLGADAIKIGMLYSAELIGAVVQSLKKYPPAPLVLDPVMVAQSGDSLLEQSAIEALKHELIPRATIITPNIPEAEVLLARSIRDIEDMESAAASLAALGCEAVLIKGGHLATEYSDDILYLSEERRSMRFRAPRIATRNNHGTGCTLSSAIAAGLAHDLSLIQAVEQGKQYLSGALAAGASYRIGSGHGPAHHFFRFFE